VNRAGRISERRDDANDWQSRVEVVARGKFKWSPAIDFNRTGHPQYGPQRTFDLTRHLWRFDRLLTTMPINESKVARRIATLASFAVRGRKSAIAIQREMRRTGIH
jgi:hypothetical protein